MAQAAGLCHVSLIMTFAEDQRRLKSISIPLALDKICTLRYKVPRRCLRSQLFAGYHPGGGCRVSCLTASICACFRHAPPVANRFGLWRTELSVGPLTIGLNGALHIREERLSIRVDACRLMYVSDIHLRRTRSDNLCRQVIESARSSEIDVLLLGGDLVDGPSELGKLSDLVGALCEVAPVFAVGGNHDRHVGMNRVRDEIGRAHVLTPVTSLSRMPSSA